MMASELAESICETYFNNSEGALLRNVIDAELQEVRDVLTQLAEWPFPVGQPCWCHLEGEHSDACQRARRLAERLRVG